jgi:hypothetical protein
MEDNAFPFAGDVGGEHHRGEQPPAEPVAPVMPPRAVPARARATPFALGAPPQNLPDFAPSGSTSDEVFWDIFHEFAASGEAVTDAQRRSVYWALLKYFIINTTSGRETHTAGFVMGGRRFDLPIIARRAGSFRKFARNAGFADDGLQFMEANKNEPWMRKHLADRGYKPEDYLIAFDFVLASTRLLEPQRRRAMHYARRHLDDNRRNLQEQRMQDEAEAPLPPYENTDNAYN